MNNLQPFNNMSSGVIIINDRAEVLSINSSAIEFLGLMDPKSIIGKNFLQILPNVFTHIEITSAGLLKKTITDARTGKNSSFDILINEILDSESSQERWILLFQPHKENGSANKLIAEDDLEKKITARTEELSNLVTKLEEEIHERRRSEENLRDSEEKFRSVIEQSSEAFVLINSEGRILETNHAFEQMTGRNRVDILGKISWYFLAEMISNRNLSDDQKIDYHTVITDALHGGQSDHPLHEYVVEINKSNGTQRILTQTFFLVRNEEGDRLAMIARDITEQRQAMNSARQNERNMNDINRMSAELASLSTLDEIYRKVSDRVRTITGSVACTFSSYHEDRNSLMVEYISSSSKILQRVFNWLPEYSKRKWIPLSKNDHEFLLENPVGRIQTLSKLSFGSIPDTIGQIVQSSLNVDYFIGVSISTERELFGTLTLGISSKSSPPSDEMLSTIANVVSVSIKRKMVEHELRINEERYRTLFENTHDLISVIDSAGKRLIVANLNSFNRILGYDQADLVNHSIFEIIHPDDQEKVRSIQDAMLLGKLDHETIEYRVRRKDNKWIYLEVEFNNMLGDPLVNGIVATSRDVTERKTAQEEIYQSEERFHQMFEKHHAVMLLVSPENGMILDANRASSEFYGYPIEVLRQMNISQINTMPSDQIQAKLKSVAAGEKKKYIFTHKLASGELRTVEVHSSIIQERRAPILFSIITDITDRIQAEKQREDALISLRESEEQIQSIFRAAPTGIGVVRDRVLLYVNPKICEMVGYSAEELIGKSARILYPSDEEFEFVGKEKYRQIAEHDTGQVETIWKKKDGSLINIILSSTPIDPHDLKRGVTFTALDITDRKIAEKALADSEEKFRRIFEASEIGISINSPDGQFLTCNPALTRILGYSEEEYAALTIGEISHPDDRDLDLGLYQEALEGKRNYYTIEKRNRHKDGHYVWGLLTSVMVRDGNNKPLYGMGMFQDITKRKETEEALNDQEKFVRTIIDTVPVGIFVVNKEGVINYLNPAGQNIWQGVRYVGVEDLKEYKGWRLSDGKLLDSRDWGSARAVVDGEITLDEEIEIEAFDGTRKIIANSGIPLYDDAGNITGAVAILQDITERKRSEKALQQYSEDLRNAYYETLKGWSNALELREHETAGHSLRVVNLTIQLAKEFKIGEDELQHIERGALLHDIGKMGIPDSILLKPGPLTADEWVVMKQHPVFAKQLLSNIPYLGPALDIPLFHHERWNGSGYPQGLKGKNIPLAARIFAVVDVWDALRSDRPYRKGWPEAEVIHYLKEKSGELLDPDVVKVFLNLIKK